MGNCTVAEAAILIFFSSIVYLFAFCGGGGERLQKHTPRVALPVFGVFPTFLPFFGCVFLMHVFVCLHICSLPIQCEQARTAIFKAITTANTVFIWWAIVKICQSGNHYFSSLSYPIVSISKSTVHGLQINLSQPSISLSPPPMMSCQ